MWFEVMSFWRHVSLFALSNLHVALNMLGKAQALSMVVWAWLWPWLLAFKRQGIRAKRGWNAPMSGPSGLGTESLPIGSICGASVLARFAEGSFAVTWCWDGTCCNLRRHSYTAGQHNRGLLHFSKKRNWQHDCRDSKDFVCLSGFCACTSSSITSTQSASPDRPFGPWRWLWARGICAKQIIGTQFCWEPSRWLRCFFRCYHQPRTVLMCWHALMGASCRRGRWCWIWTWRLGTRPFPSLSFQQKVNRSKDAQSEGVSWTLSDSCKLQSVHGHLRPMYSEVLTRSHAPAKASKQTCRAEAWAALHRDETLNTCFLCPNSATRPPLWNTLVLQRQGFPKVAKQPRCFSRDHFAVVLPKQL